MIRVVDKMGTTKERGRTMFEWQVSFYLNDMLHQYVIDADNEADAYIKVVKCLVNKKIMHGLKVERYQRPW